MARQGAFTAAAEIADGKVESLRAHLLGIGKLVGEPGCSINFQRLTSVHFMRWVILDANIDTIGQPIPPSLVLSTNYDEPRTDHLQQLVEVVGPQFDIIYGHCRGFGAENDAERVRFLEAHGVAYAAFYVGTRGRGVSQILKESELRDNIQTHLDGANLRGLPPEQIHASLRAKFTTGEFTWVGEPDGVPPRGVPLYSIARAVVAVATLAIGAWLLSWTGVGLAWWIVLVIPVGLVAAVLLVVLFLLTIRAHEKWERLPAVRLAGAPIGDLVLREDQVVQNQLTNVVVIKPRLFRRITLRLVLLSIHLLGRAVFVRGALGGIPSIHFARWVVVDRGRRLLFMSNFDGSWENYLGDFIDKANYGLTGIWSNTIGCPPARFLVFDGARDERRFKGWVRENQLVTQVWYSAYRNLSVENINNNTRIRQGLTKPLSAEAARQWLALL